MHIGTSQQKQQQQQQNFIKKNKIEYNTVYLYIHNILEVDGMRRKIAYSMHAHRNVMHGKRIK